MANKKSVILIYSFFLVLIVALLSVFLLFRGNQSSKDGALTSNLNQILVRNGVELSLRKENVIVLNFWASWCSPCVEEFPSLLKLAKLLPDQVLIVGISQDSDEKELESFLRLYDFKSLPNFIIIKDTEHLISQEFGVERLPESTLYRRNGELLKKVVGSIDWAAADVVNFVKAVR